MARQSVNHRMNAEYRKKRSYATTAHGKRAEYVHDNLARQVEEIPERRHRARPVRKQKKQPKAFDLPSISFGTFAFICALCVVVALAGGYLVYLSTSLTAMQGEIVSLQKENEASSIANKEKYDQILESVDLSEVYDVATGEFGMVNAVGSQIFKYNSQKSDMVKQYADIPSNTKN